jgi:phosphoribosylformimino-5-aminoimidazole carboxamide ribotide isomerase
VAFDIIPALDLSDGRLCRLTADGQQPLSAFGGDPLLAAAKFLDDGARWLHVVDLDLATLGVARNLAAIEKLARLGVAVQASGGIRTPSSVSAMIDVGAERVVIGSGALGDRSMVDALLGREQDRLFVGIEVEGDRVRSRGLDPVDLPLGATLAWLADTPVRGFLLTMVGHVGGLGGTDLRTVEAAVALGRPVLVAGGISTVEHMATVRDLGAGGVVVGRAALEGKLDLRRAIEHFE